MATHIVGQSTWVENKLLLTTLCPLSPCASSSSWSLLDSFSKHLKLLFFAERAPLFQAIPIKKTLFTVSLMFLADLVGNIWFYLWLSLSSYYELLSFSSCRFPNIYSNDNRLFQTANWSRSFLAALQWWAWLIIYNNI